MGNLFVSFAHVNEAIKTVGLMVGGLWVAWTFHKLQRARAAELANSQAVLAIKQSELAIKKSLSDEQQLRTQVLRQQSLLSIEMNVIEAIELDAPTSVTVTLKNEGDHPLKASFDDTSLTCAKVVVDASGECRVVNVHRAPHWYFSPKDDIPRAFISRTFRAGQTRNAVFIVPVTEPGVYLLQFHTMYHQVLANGQEDELGAFPPYNSYQHAIHVRSIRSPKNSTGPG